MHTDKVHRMSLPEHNEREKEAWKMAPKKELTEQEKKDLAMKYEIAEELGLLDKVEQFGWKGLTAKESGRIGGILAHMDQEKKAHDVR